MVSVSFDKAERARACNSGVGVAKLKIPPGTSTSLIMEPTSLSKAMLRWVTGSALSGTQANSRSARSPADLNRFII